QLLRFAQLSEGDMVLTEAGMRFAHLETDARKKLFAYDEQSETFSLENPH
ncbi:MAG TPA: AAA-associated domain-containing protein, partial [Methylocella sp.]|nr:AAA-associated domain-containing protein [Methylocella sp.]